MQVEAIPYALNGKKFEGQLCHDETARGPRALLLMCPNWAGVTPRAIEIGRQLAAEGYVVMVADMHGLDRRPTGTENPMEFLAPLTGDPRETRARVNAAMDALIVSAFDVEVGHRRATCARRVHGNEAGSG